METKRAGGVKHVPPGERTFTAGAGSFVYIPRGTVHRFKNVGETTARMLLMSTPARAESERVLLPLLATREARDILARAQEEAAIEAQDFWTQAEEANAIDPVG